MELERWMFKRSYMRRRRNKVGASITQMLACTCDFVQQDSEETGVTTRHSGMIGVIFYRDLHDSYNMLFEQPTNISKHMMEIESALC